jgi:hypothetical protein
MNQPMTSIPSDHPQVSRSDQGIINYAKSLAASELVQQHPVHEVQRIRAMLVIHFFEFYYILAPFLGMKGLVPTQN